MQQGRLQEARADLETAKATDPHNPYVWSSLAELYLRLGDKPSASSAAETAAKLGGQDPIVCHALAIYFAKTGAFARAAKLEQTYAESARADKSALLRAGQYDLQAGDEQAALALAERPSQSDLSLAFEWAQMLLRNERFTSAATLLEQDLKANPGNAQLTLALGVARYGQRRFEDAIAIFLNVIRIDPAIEQSYEFLGRMLDQAGSRLPEIVAADEEWSTDNPENSKAQLELAKALLLEHPDDPRPESLLRQSLALDASNWEAHYQLGVLLADQHKYEDAARELNEAIRLDPKQAMPHYRLARVYDRLGQPDKAAEERKAHAGLIAPGHH